MINLSFNLRTAYESGCLSHPQIAMEELGITYLHATPQTLGDCWWFWGCVCDVSKLPEYLTTMNILPMDVIGWGLSEEKAIELTKYI